ncbi:riboflavin kinase / FMN adenylyltransferase [Ruminococcaceae bacterium FB2012]|nr:riboflavin kinase / FMN adenylyltransferase [Ruminococcaceae bacterium FB2012]
MKDITNERGPLEWRTAVALGVFDGVHLGHRTVIDKAVSLGKGELRSVVFTFRQGSVTNKGSVRLLSDEDKFYRLSQRRVDLVCSPDLGEVRDMSAEDFVREILVGRLRCRFAVCGKDFRFGRGAAGDVSLLERLGEECGFLTVVLDKLSLGGETVSSTAIKEHISRGEIVRANEMLGYRFGYRLPVIHGRELGRTWDFPTINQQLPEGIVMPRFGVYCSRVKIDGKAYTGVTDIGVKPTVGKETTPLSETYILGFGGDLYGRVIQVSLERFIRPEKKFDSIDELRAQIARDTEDAARTVF